MSQAGRPNRDSLSAQHGTGPVSLHCRPARWAALLAMALASGLVHADDGGGVALTPLYQQECGACHTAYQPGLLPQVSWQHLMDNLPRHFGVDASLDAAQGKTIANWLGTHAATYRRVSEAPPEDRITRSAWFVRKHREVAPATFKRAAIGSPANCTACHRSADQGDFDEDNVRIPK